jgi:hypothetical protein
MELMVSSLDRKDCAELGLVTFRASQAPTEHIAEKVQVVVGHTTAEVLVEICEVLC